jgi:hypothetical protein
MSSNQAVAVSVGLLVWGWTLLSFMHLEPRILTWITFLTWASFYAAGAGPGGLVRSIASGLLGALASAAVIWLNTTLGQSAYPLLVLSFLLGMLGWFLCIVASRPLLSCIPATFIGAAAFFGAGSPMDLKFLTVLGSIIIGAFLGLTSQRLAELFTKPKSIKTETTPA